MKLLFGLLISTYVFGDHQVNHSFQIYEVKNINGKKITLDFGLSAPTNLNSITVVSDKELAEAKGGKTTDDCKEICGEKHCLKNGEYTLASKVEGKIAIAFNKTDKVENFRHLEMAGINNFDDLIKEIKPQEPKLEATGYSYELVSNSKIKSLDLSLKLKGKLLGTENDCRASKINDFRLIKCKENILLYSNNNLLLVSSTDSYEKVDITLYSEFEMNGTKFYLISFGTKGRTYKALLKKIGERWQLIKGIDDYPTTC